MINCDCRACASLPQALQSIVGFVTNQLKVIHQMFPVMTVSICPFDMGPHILLLKSKHGNVPYKSYVLIHLYLDAAQ